MLMLGLMGRLVSTGNQICGTSRNASTVFIGCLALLPQIFGKDSKVKMCVGKVSKVR